MNTIFALIALFGIAYAFVPWVPNWATAQYLGQTFREGAVRIFKSPWSDWKADMDRVILALAVILLVLALLPDTKPAQSFKDAVIEFQQEHGLTPDGIWGAKTNTAYTLYLRGL